MTTTTSSTSSPPPPSSTPSLSPPSSPLPTTHSLSPSPSPLPTTHPPTPPPPHSSILSTITRSKSTLVITLPVTSSPTTFTTLSSSHLPVHPYPYNGGPGLPGTCATPEFTLILDAQSAAIIYAPVIGCIDDRPGCCLTQVTTTTATVTTTEIATQITSYIFPGALSPDRFVLPNCPDDYETFLTVCCPS